jgi:hypothetical protein
MAAVERVKSFKFLCVHITEDLTSTNHTDIVVKKDVTVTEEIWHGPSDPQKVSQLHHQEYLDSITTWYGNCTAINRKALPRVVWSAQYITGGKLPSLQEIYTWRCLRMTWKIVKESSHPCHGLLPSCRHYQSFRTWTKRLRDSFYHKAIRLLKSKP